MPFEEDETSILTRPLRFLPPDLAVTAILVTVALLVILIPGVRETPLRLVFGVPFLLFFPGYAFIAAVFPAAGDFPHTADQGNRNEGTGPVGRINSLERIALSFGISFAVVPLIVMMLNFFWEIQLLPVIATVSGFTYLMTFIAGYRRTQLPDEQQFRLPLDKWSTGKWMRGFGRVNTRDAVVNGMMILILLVAIGSVGYAFAIPKSGESFTEFYYLSADETGTLGTTNVSSTVEVGDTQPIIVGVSNHEYQSVNYTWVVKLQEIEIANNSSSVIRSEELGREHVKLDHNETSHTTFSLQPTFSGSQLRVAFLLYKTSPPANPTAQNAYHKTHLWINVSENPETGVAKMSPENQAYWPSHTSGSPVINSERPRLPATGYA